MPQQRTYPKASATDPVSPADLRRIIDTHGLRFTERVVDSEEARELLRLYGRWIALQGIRPDLAYIMPLDAAFEQLAASHGGRINERGMYAWRVLTNAVNDPRAGLQIVQRRFTSRRAA